MLSNRGKTAIFKAALFEDGEEALVFCVFAEDTEFKRDAGQSAAKI